jgi:hypothetical protein
MGADHLATKGFKLFQLKNGKQHFAISQELRREGELPTAETSNG